MIQNFFNKILHFISDILSSCKSHRDCKDLKYSQCLSGRCRCLSNYYKRNSNVCLGGINATCDSDYDCRHNHLVGCISNTCQSYATFFARSNDEEVKLYRAESKNFFCYCTYWAWLKNGALLSLKNIDFNIIWHWIEPKDHIVNINDKKKTLLKRKVINKLIKNFFWLIKCHSYVR